MNSLNLHLILSRILPAPMGLLVCGHTFSAFWDQVIPNAAIRTTELSVPSQSSRLDFKTTNGLQALPHTVAGRAFVIALIRSRQ